MRNLLLTSFLIFGFCLTGESQRNKLEKFEPIYSGCEVENCYGSRMLSFSDTTKLLLRVCDHSTGCTRFKNSGTWTQTSEGIIIKPNANLKVIHDLDGLFYRLKKENYELLIHQTIISDSTSIMNEIEEGYKNSEDYKMFFVDFANNDKTVLEKVRKKLIRNHIMQQLTWRHRILLKYESQE